MAVMTFDDGSTIDTETLAATNSPPGYLLSDYSNNFAPSNASPGAKSWADVLAYGFGRIVDYKVASIQAQNTPPQYAQQRNPATPGAPASGMGLGTVFIIGAAVVAVVLLATSKS